ncbi:MAG: hypothetical protein U0232_29105 [Thermomicrobiales bacterium]
MRADVERVVAHLVASWRRVFHLTTIDQVLVALGVAPSWELRRAVADRLTVEPELSPVLRRWGVATFALSNDERLLGRELARAGGALALIDLGERLELVVSAVRERLRMLDHLGVVTLAGERVTLAPDHADRLGPLGWHFHDGVVGLHAAGAAGRSADASPMIAPPTVTASPTTARVAQVSPTTTPTTTRTATRPPATPTTAPSASPTQARASATPRRGAGRRGRRDPGRRGRGGDADGHADAVHTDRR